MNNELIEKMNSKLKPCPFCGEDALLLPSKVRKGYECAVECCNCLAYMISITYDTEQEAIDEIIERWNIRANLV